MDRELEAVGVNLLQKAVTTVNNWLTVGPSPKVRDPQNSSARCGPTSGVTVTEESALTVSTFFACLRLIVQTIGSLPLPVYRRGKDGIAVEAWDTPLYRILKVAPNADQTPMEFVELIMVSLLLRGHFYARKLVAAGRLIGLEPVRPDIVRVTRSSTGARRYRWSANGQNFDLDESEMFHVRGFGGGLSVMAYARESLGIAIAADRAAGSMFGNGIRVSGVISQEKRFESREKRDEMQAHMEENFAGAMNAGKPLFLDGGLTWTAISMKADEAQLLESRAWSVEEVCRWFGVPPVLIGHTEKQTSFGSGVEQILLGFLKFALAPHLKRIEMAIAQQLISRVEQKNGLFAEFNLEGLLRSDSQGRARFYEIMTRIGVMSRNECRAKENLPPKEGGDEILVQSQYIPLEDALRQAAEKAAEGVTMKEAGVKHDIKRTLKMRDFALSVKADAVSDDGTFEGYGSVFDVVDSYKEVVAPGAFAESLAELSAKGRKLPVLWQHRHDQPIGVYLELAEDEHGLKVKGQLLTSAVALAAEAHALMKAGAVTGLSIGYWVRESSYDEKTGVRTLSKLDLVEVSVVTMPANDEARVEDIKHILASGDLPTERQFEKFLRDAGGFSRRLAAAIAAKAAPCLQRDSADVGVSTEAFAAELVEALRG